MVFRTIFSLISTSWWLYANLPLLTLPFFFIGFFSIATYVIPTLFQNFYVKPQNLKIKYNAKWALVTGGSSGIGAALVRKCASQGINVVIVSLDDKFLADTTAAVGKEFPNVEVRSVGVDLAGPDYMSKIIDSTKDIEINIVFNNAGYILQKLYLNEQIEKIKANFDCNVTNYLLITHHFAYLIRERGEKGLIGFTSSPGGFLPAPPSVMYASTKAFVTTFAASLGPDLSVDGIDVCVLHPSPTQSRFYEGSRGRLPLQDFFESKAAGPEEIADSFFANAGRFIVVDQGYITMGFRFITKILDWNFLTELTKFGISYVAGYPNLRAEYVKSSEEKKEE